MHVTAKPLIILDFCGIVFINEVIAKSTTWAGQFKIKKISNY